jgi:hypothetical protein
MAEFHLSGLPARAVGANARRNDNFWPLLGGTKSDGSPFVRNYPQHGRSIMKARFPAALVVVSIGRKHGNTLIRTLRKTYGDHFAERCRDDEKLGDVLHKMDEPSLSKLLHDRQRGKLDEICRHSA